MLRLSQRRRALAFGILLVVIGLSANPAQGQTDPEQELADRYAPVMLLKAQEEECDTSGEQYAPAAAELVLDNPDVLLRQVGSGNPVMVQGPRAADLFGLGPGFYLDFPGDALAPGCAYERDFRRYSAGQPAVVYAHVATQDDAPGQLALQYWFFYYYNDYTNLHEGDWEGIQILFDVGTVEEALGAEPVSIGYGQHFGGERADWDSEKLERRGTHPVVYPAVGSHASYFTSTLYIGRSGSEGFGCDNTEGPSNEIEPETVVLPATVDDPADPLAWLAFEGHWGERQSEPFNGPTGPAEKGRWTAPIDWHNDLRSSSVAVPGGADTSTPVINTFCQVVEWGSGQYITLQQNPIRLLLTVAVAGVALFFTLGRTKWDTVRAVPIARRRRVGQIIVSTARLYRREPRRMMELGLLYLPIAIVIGIVIAVVQQLLLLALPTGSDADLGPVGLAVVAVVGGLGQTVAFAVVTAAAAVVMASLEQGEEIKGWDVYRRVFERFDDLAAGLARAVAIVGLLALTIVGIPFAIHRVIRYQFLTQTTMLEGRRAQSALDRSSELVAGRWFHTAAVIIVLGGVVSLVNGIVGLLLLIALAGLPLWLFSILITTASALVIPFSAVGNVLLYGDARAEYEQLDSADLVPASSSDG